LALLHSSLEQDWQLSEVLSGDASVAHVAHNVVPSKLSKSHDWAQLPGTGAHSSRPSSFVQCPEGQVMQLYELRTEDVLVAQSAHSVDPLKLS